MTRIHLDVRTTTTPTSQHIAVTARERAEDGVWHQLGQKVIDTRDELFRQSLIDLGWTPPRAAPLGTRAMFTAMTLHATQVRKYTGEPYFHHLAEVAGMVASVGAPDPVIAAAWLHDSREDQDYPGSALEAEFGPGVARMVAALSDLEEGNRAARKAAARARLAAAEPWAQTIKCADLVSNAHRIMLHDPKFAPVFIDEARQLLAVLTRADSRLRGMAIATVSQPGELT